MNARKADVQTFLFQNSFYFAFWIVLGHMCTQISAVLPTSTALV